VTAGASRRDATAPAAHLPVLLDEALAALAVRPDGRYLDATYGRGGHSAALLRQLGTEGRLLAIDRDPAAAKAAARHGGDPRFRFCRLPFAALDEALALAGWNEIDGALFDLGVSSPQLDDPERGFSFMRDGPLDLRMDPDSGPSAAEWLRTADEREIARVLKDYGEERLARRIARAIVQRRAGAPLTTTRQLADLVVACGVSRQPGKHPATRTFQALRIVVNDELRQLDEALNKALGKLAAGGRLVVISFHSLEDRCVKRAFAAVARPPPGNRRRPPRAVPPLRYRLVGRALRPGAAEMAANPRSRSAVLRAVERVA